MAQFTKIEVGSTVKLLGPKVGPVCVSIEPKSSSQIATVTINHPNESGLPITLNSTTPQFQFSEQFITTKTTTITNSSASTTPVFLAHTGEAQSVTTTTSTPNKREQPTSANDDEQEEIISPAEKKAKKSVVSDEGAKKQVSLEKEPKQEEKSKEPANQVFKMPNGLQYSNVEVGKGPSVSKGSTCAIRYRGLFTNGQVFDSNMPKGRLLTFTVGRGEVITGMEQGMIGMQTGGKRRLIIPSQLGYGRAGSPPQIPPNATLIFDVELVKVSK